MSFMSLWLWSADLSLRRQQQNNFTTTFDKSSCQIRNSCGAVIANGVVAGHHRLYRLSLSRVSAEHRALAISAHAPTLETWHKRLGHANYHTVLVRV
jgi:hypothetical protein